MNDISSIELVMDEKNLRIYPELALYKDSGVVQNPRSHFRTGKWRLRKSDQGPVLMLSFDGKKMNAKYDFPPNAADAEVWLAATFEADKAAGTWSLRVKQDGSEVAAGTWSVTKK